MSQSIYIEIYSILTCHLLLYLKLELSLAGLSGKASGKVRSYMDLLEKKFIYPCVIDPGADNTEELWSPNERDSNYSSGGGSVFSTSVDGAILTLNSPKAIVVTKSEPTSFDL